MALDEAAFYTMLVGGVVLTFGVALNSYRMARRQIGNAVVGTGVVVWVLGAFTLIYLGIAN